MENLDVRGDTLLLESLFKREHLTVKIGDSKIHNMRSLHDAQSKIRFWSKTKIILRFGKDFASR